MVNMGHYSFHSHLVLCSMYSLFFFSYILFFAFCLIFLELNMIFICMYVGVSNNRLFIFINTCSYAISICFILCLF